MNNAIHFMTKMFINNKIIIRDHIKPYLLLLFHLKNAKCFNNPSIKRI